MPPIILTLLQGLFLLLLYVFIARAVRAVVRDVQAPDFAKAPVRKPAQRPANRPRQPAPKRAESERVKPREVVVHSSSGRPRVLTLDDSDIVFGRASGTTVTLDDPYVSDRHAKISRENDAWVIRDLGSTNGTFLNQVKVAGPTPIAAGDQLGIGRTVVEVRK